jgi:hypothetical protein
MEYYVALLGEKMNKKFIIKTCSDLDFEGMVVDIEYDGNTIAMISHEKGLDNMDIEIFASPHPILPLLFPLDEFLSAIASAKEELSLPPIDSED